MSQVQTLSPSNSKIYKTNHLDRLQTFHHNKLFYDIALVAEVDNFKVYAHRIILCASSEFFLALLSKESNPDVIKLKVDGATLTSIVDFMYTATIDFQCETVQNILKAAEYFQMETLKAACCDFLVENINISNCLGIASMAEEHRYTLLYNKSYGFALKRFEKVRLEEEFMHLNEQQLGKLIASDDLCVNSEETVVLSLVAWMQYDYANREKLMPNLLSKIRYSFLKPAFIEKIRQSVCFDNESGNLVSSWLKSQQTEHKARKTNEWQTLAFVSGGWSTDLKLQTFIPKANTWLSQDIPPCSIKRNRYGATVINKKLIIAGGSGQRVVECLDLQTNQWTSLPPMSQELETPAMAVINNDLYVIGGFTNGDWSCAVEKYNFLTCKWQEIAPLNSKFRHVQVTVLGGLLYAAGYGGYPIECYDPATNEWTPIPNKNELTESYSIAGIDEHVYAVGGYYNGEACKTVERYDPLSKTWETINPGLKEGVRDLLCISWNNRLVGCKGRNARGYFQNLFEVIEYDPEMNDWKTLASLEPHNLGHSFLNLLTI